MTAQALLFQLLNGFAGASTLFLVAVGLSLIFGVTRIVNFAHGSLYMLGAFIAYSLVSRAAGFFGFWAGIAAAALITAAIGALIEMALLRRIYKAPELFQLLATFAVTLIVRDITLELWGPEDLFGPRAPGLRGSVEILDRRFPEYDLFLIAVGPAVLGLLWLVLKRTRFGILIRAATQDREMAAALGVNQKVLFTAVFALGAGLAGLGGALQMPREPANLALDLAVIGDAFVVVVVGGMGSIPGAYLAALLIAEIKAICIAIGTVSLFGVTVSFSKFTLVAEFVVMAVVLIFRPWGLLGRPPTDARGDAHRELPLAPPGRSFNFAAAAGFGCLALVPAVFANTPYMMVLGIEIAVAALFAASLHLIMGPGGLHSFGHAAYFGLGAYGAGILLKQAGMPMELALVLAPAAAVLGAVLFGWFSVRLAGVYFAMLTLAFAQIVWSVVFQWDDVTGGSNGLVGIWPAPWLASKSAYYLLTLCLAAASLVCLRRLVFSPFGQALRAARDSTLRSEVIGIDTARVRWIAFIIAGGFCGLAGGLFAFSKGSISPDTISVGRSVDGLVMVLMGGIQSLTGPIAGAAVFTLLQDTVTRQTEYWRGLLGLVIVMIVLVFPQGIAGSLRHWFARR